MCHPLACLSSWKAVRSKEVQKKNREKRFHRLSINWKLLIQRRMKKRSEKKLFSFIFSPPISSSCDCADAECERAEKRNKRAKWENRRFFSFSRPIMCNKHPSTSRRPLDYRNPPKLFWHIFSSALLYAFKKERKIIIECIEEELFDKSLIFYFVSFFLLLFATYICCCCDESCTAAYIRAARALRMAIRVRGAIFIWFQFHEEIWKRRKSNDWIKGKRVSLKNILAFEMQINFFDFSKDNLADQVDRKVPEIKYIARLNPIKILSWFLDKSLDRKRERSFYLQIALWLYAGPSVTDNAWPTWVCVRPRESLWSLNAWANSLISSRSIPSGIEPSRWLLAPSSDD